MRERDRKDEGGKTGGAPGTRTLRGHEEFRGKRSVGGVRTTANAERPVRRRGPRDTSLGVNIKRKGTLGYCLGFCLE